MNTCTVERWLQIRCIQVSLSDNNRAAFIRVWPRLFAERDDHHEVLGVRCGPRRRCLRTVGEFNRRTDAFQDLLTESAGRK